MLVRGVRPLTNIPCSANTAHGNGLRSVQGFASGQPQGMAYAPIGTSIPPTEPGKKKAPFRGPAFRGFRQRKPGVFNR